MSTEQGASTRNQICKRCGEVGHVASIPPEPAGNNCRAAMAARRRPDDIVTRLEGTSEAYPPAIADVVSPRRLAQLETDRRTALRDAERRAEDEAREGARLATGDWFPAKMDHESKDEFLTRRTAWLETEQGATAVARKNRRDREAQDAANVAAWPDVVENACVPKQFAELLGACVLQPSDALVEIKRKSFEILVLAGKVGVGKSVAAAWWLLQDYLPGGAGDNEAMPSSRKAGRPLWVSAARLSRWSRYDDAEMDRLLVPRRLVIDDLYTEFADSKGNFLAILDEVVNDRMGNRRPLVITTNTDVEGFKDRYGERIVDRIREHGRFCTFAGESMRRKA